MDSEIARPSFLDESKITVELFELIEFGSKSNSGNFCVFLIHESQVIRYVFFKRVNQQQLLLFLEMNRVAHLISFGLPKAENSSHHRMRGSVRKFSDYFPKHFFLIFFNLDLKILISERNKSKRIKKTHKDVLHFRNQKNTEPKRRNTPKWAASVCHAPVEGRSGAA